MSITYASCKMLCSYATQCPLCGATIPAMTGHECVKDEKEGPAKPTRKARKKAKA